MTAIETLLQQPAAQAIGWALIHFTWQGALIGALTAAALATLRRSAADVRYVVAASGLALMLTMPAVTAVQTWNAAADGGDGLSDPTSQLQNSNVEGSVVAAPMPMAPGEAAADIAARSQRQPAATRWLEHVRVEPWLPLMVMAWLCGVVVLTLRLLSGWLWVQRMKSHGTTAAPDGWQVIAARLSRRLHISRPVQLLESALVEVPTVIGWMKPVVLLPASALAGLTPHQLEAILAHELAHIRRHDYLVNLGQALVETLLFYHPAVWWLSHRIRVEREHCCDDLAVSLCGDPYTYARALANLEQLRGSGSLVMAANGGSLLQRVRRLVSAPSHAGREPGWLAGSAAILLLLMIAAGAAQGQVQRVPSVPVQPEVPGVPSVLALADGQWPPAPPAPPAPPELPGVPSVPAPAALPAPGAPPPVPPAPASPPAPPAPSHQDSGNFTWQNNGERVDIKYSGRFEFTADDTDVARLSPGGYLRMSDSRFFGGQTVEFRADASGAITRRYWKGWSEHPFEPEGRAWLATALPRFIRQSGIGAKARVARILEAKGPAGVLAEISLIEGGWAKRVYFNALLGEGPLDPATVQRVLQQAGAELDSDYELASLLISKADLLLVDDRTRAAYFSAAKTIGSDYEMRRVFGSALKKGPMAPALLGELLSSATSIASDYELASLLIDVAKLQPLDRAMDRPFFAALGTVQSDYEKRRVLTALAARGDATPEQYAAMLEAAATVGSDHEASSFLMLVVRDRPIEGSLRAPFFRAVDAISSGHDRGRVLQAVLARTDASPETVLAVLKSAQAMSGNDHVAQALIAAATGKLRTQN